MATGSVQPLIQCLTINIKGVAITSPNMSGYYAYEIDSGIAPIQGFKFLCASPKKGAWDTGTNIVNMYLNDEGKMVYSVTAPQSYTVDHEREFNIFYTIE